MKTYSPRNLLHPAVLSAGILFLAAVQTYGEPAAPLTSPEQMDAEAFSGLMGRLRLNASDFEEPAPVEPKDGDQGKSASDAAATAAAKKKEEEDAQRALDDAAGGIDYGKLGVTEEQQTSIEQALAGPAEELEGALEVLKLTEAQKQAVLDHHAAAAAPPTDEPPAGDFDIEALGLTDEQKTAVTAALEAAKQPGGGADKLKADLDAANAEVARLTGEAQGRTRQPVAVANLHPAFMLGDAAKINAYERQLRQFKQWATDNWDGSEAVEAHGDVPAQPAYAKEDVRKRYAQISDELETKVPQARQLLAAQRHADQLAQAAYPDLFKDKTPEKTIAENIIAQAPGLGAIFPNIRMIIGDALVGEKLRLAKDKAAKKPAAPGMSNAAKRPAPKLPTGQRPARPAPTTAARKDSNISEAAFSDLKSGGMSERDAIAHLVMGTNLAGN